MGCRLENTSGKEIVTIAGAGVAGSYLAHLLEDKFFVQVYDGAKRRGCGCAWGSFYTQMQSHLKHLGLNVEDYVLNRTKNLVLNGMHIRLLNEFSINKPKMLEDLYSSKKIIPSNIPLYNVGYEKLIVNATALPFGEYYKIPCIQVKVQLEGLEKDTAYVNIDPNYTGYGWIFPLDDEGKIFHLGAGCVNADPQRLIDKIVAKYKVTVEDTFCRCTRNIAIVNPDTPIIIEGNVVSVGEAAGCVYPVTGEGIDPSIRSVRMLAGILSAEFPLQIYEGRLRKEMLDDYKPAFKVWRLMHTHARLAWLSGFTYMTERAKTRAQPIITKSIRLRLLLKMLSPFS